MERDYGQSVIFFPFLTITLFSFLLYDASARGSDRIFHERALRRKYEANLLWTRHRDHSLPGVDGSDPGANATGTADFSGGAF